MSRLDIKTASKAQTVVDRLYKDMERRIASSPPGLCPIDMSLTFLQLCHAQSCGKCVPCRDRPRAAGCADGGRCYDGTGTMLTIDTIEKTARAIVASAGLRHRTRCGAAGLKRLRGLPGRLCEAHVQHHRCLCIAANSPVPCVSLCPGGRGCARVCRAGARGALCATRCASSERITPCPTACAHDLRASVRGALPPQYGRCARQYPRASSATRSTTQETFRILPARHPPASVWRSSAAARAVFPAAYYLRLMGHDVTIFEEKKKLGGMLRYGIPAYRLPREVLGCGDRRDPCLPASRYKPECQRRKGHFPRASSAQRLRLPVYRHRRAHRQAKSAFEGEEQPRA